MRELKKNVFDIIFGDCVTLGWGMWPLINSMAIDLNRASNSEKNTLDQTVDLQFYKDEKIYIQWGDIFLKKSKDEMIIVCVYKKKWWLVDAQAD